MTRRQYPAWVRRRRRGAADRTIMHDLAIALTAGDRPGIRAMLRCDVVLVVDSGGLMPESSTPVEGRAAASARLVALLTAETSATLASINGVQGLVLLRDGAVVAAITAESRSRLLSNVWVVCNPDKLRHWNRGSDG
ncbi:hypothetical protein [Microbacterium phyllosphaerae]